MGGPSDGSERRRAWRVGWIAVGMVAAVVLVFVFVRIFDRAASRPTAPGDRPAPQETASESTRRMAARLRALAEAADPAENPYLNAARAELYRERLAAADVSPAASVDLRIRIGLELLRAGDTGPAIDALREAAARLESLPPGDREATEWTLEQFLGVAHLRLGEQENCVARHTSDSCLFPIAGEGVHEVERGGRGALRHFVRAVELFPDDLGSAWLANLAAMVVGEYPEALPRRLRLPPNALESQAPQARLTDVAPQVGAAVIGLSGGVAVDDFNGDGTLDIVCSSWGLRDPIRYLESDGAGRFVDRTSGAGLAGLVGGLNLTSADYDNDGDADVLVLRGAWMGEQGRYPNSLLRNRGDGFFEDVTLAAGLDEEMPTQTAAWGDFDGDGWLDLYVGNESDDMQSHPCSLYHNQRDGTFRDVAPAVGLDVEAFVKGVAWGDVDNDGDPDLYVSCLGEPNLLFRNDGSAADAGGSPGGGWTFTDVTETAGVGQPLHSFPVWFFDHDQDGWLDLFVASYGWERTVDKVAADYFGVPNPGERPRLFRNLQDGTFEDVTSAVGLDRVLIVMGSSHGDIDSDGFPDIYLGTGEPSLAALMPNRLFRNEGGQRFLDVTTGAGMGHLQKGHGVAFADFDRDGDQDVYTVLGGAYEGDVFQNALFENPLTDAAKGTAQWVAVELRGVRSNRGGLGARLAIELEGTEGASRVVHKLVSDGGSFGSAPRTTHVGLGAARRIRELRVTWPHTTEPQVLRDVPLRQTIVVAEGEGDFEVIEPRAFELGK